MKSVFEEIKIIQELKQASEELKCHILKQNPWKMIIQQ